MQKAFDSLKDNDIEIIVIAYLLKHPNLIDTHFENLDKSLFANVENIKIFNVLEDFYRSQKNISVDTIKNYIPDIQSKTHKDLSTQIDQIVFSKDVFSNYIETLQELYLRRELFKLTQNKNNESTKFETSNSIKDIFLDLEKKLFDLSNLKKDNYEFRNFASVTKASLKLVEKAFKKKGKYSGVVSGFVDLDNMLGGLQNSDLIILAGRPSMGKTALATNIAFNAAQKIQNNGRKSSIAFFSLEMSSEQLSTRILAEQSRIKSNDIRRGKISDEQFDKFLETSKNISELPLYIDETPAISIAALSNRARRIKRLFGLDMILVDYIQLMKGTFNNKDGRVQEISEITQGLKAIAKELSIPVVALSQLSRAVEQRDDKKPQLSDLRESGSIEQDADVVMFVYRQSYYLKSKEPRPATVEHAEWQAKMNEVSHLAELIISKQRHGPTGNITLEFEEMFTKFKDLQNN